MAQGGKLNTLVIGRLRKIGNYGDGGGLYLRVQAGASRTWAFRYKPRGTGKTHWVGLGGADLLSLAEAREKARLMRRMILDGLDPLTEERRRRAGDAAGKTFAEMMDAYIKAHQAGWKNAKHGQQWRATLHQHAGALLPLSMQAIDVAAVKAVLDPIWNEKTETASRVRGRIEAVIDYATAHGWRTGDNPARWRTHLDKMLPPRAAVAAVVHHAAVAWHEIGPVMARLAKSKGTAARCLQFATLTAARSGEARGARWNEIDLDAATWTIPAARMKAKRDHRVPLAEPALAILREMLPLKRKPDDLVFPGGKPGRPLSDVAVSKALHVAGAGDATVHGMRSTFRDWCAEATNFPREIAEAALAHSNRDKVEAAYLRGDHFEQRRKLMNSWANWCARPAGAVGNLVALRQG